jgi:hypothetical protein
VLYRRRVTDEPNSDEQGDTQLKSRSPEVLTSQHSDNLGATQHNSAKLAQFGLLILEVVGSTATRLTIDSKGLSDIDHPIHRDHSLLVVGSILTRLTVDSTQYP